MVLNILVLIGLWVALTRSADLAHLLIGVLATCLVVLVQHHLFPTLNPLSSSLLRRPQWLFAFFVTLCVRFITSTIYTCRLILLGKEEGRIVALPIKLEDPIGQFILLNAITLTPSTISLLLEGDLLYIHWLRAKGSRGDWKAIKESLEARLYPVFERKRDAHR